MKSSLDMDDLKARQKTIWEAGDFGRVARFTVPTAEEFMARLPLRPGLRVLDVACGTGNLAVIAARSSCVTFGVDVATTLIAQARERAERAGVVIEFSVGDAESLPCPDAGFDLVVSMFGIMFALRPERAVAELLRATKPGGLIALANWTPGGFMGKLSEIFSRHLPPASGLPSPLLWGDPARMREWLTHGIAELRLTPRVARLRYPFPPAETVWFFRQHYGPTMQAFAGLDGAGQAALHRDLVSLQSEHNLSPASHTTEVVVEYLEVMAVRGR